MGTKPHINLIAVLGEKTRAIGKKGGLLWHIPEDLAHFRSLTLNHPIIMGRTTFQSIGRVLPGRTNIVLTSDPNWHPEDITAVQTLDDALESARAKDTAIFIIGGGVVYEETIDLADTLYLTLVDNDASADTYFPPYEQKFKEVDRGETLTTPDGIPYRFTRWERM